MKPALLCLLLACATAPHPSVPRPEARSSVDAVLRKLPLSDEQRAALERIDAHEREQVEALREERRAEAPAGLHRGGGRHRRDPMAVGGGQAQGEGRRAMRFLIDELDSAAFLEAEARPEGPDHAADVREHLSNPGGR